MRSFVLPAVILALLMSGCRSAGDLTLRVASADASHVGVPVYLELRDGSDQRRAITSARLNESAPVELKLRNVLDGGRYQARWWVDLDGDGAPSAAASRSEPLFVHAVAGSSDLGLCYQRSSWEKFGNAALPGMPPFCSGECGPDSNSTCSDGNKCYYSAAAQQWACCSRNPISD